MTCRFLIRRDMPEVLGFSPPWQESDFLALLRQQDCVGIVAENAAGQVVGVAIYRVRRKVIQVEAIIVAPGNRRRGVGTALIGQIQLRQIRVEADVPESALPAQLFFRSLGFRAVEVRGEAYRMVWRKAAVPLVRAAGVVT